MSTDINTLSQKLGYVRQIVNNNHWNFTKSDLWIRDLRGELQSLQDQLNLLEGAEKGALLTGDGLDNVVQPVGVDGEILTLNPESDGLDWITPSHLNNLLNVGNNTHAQIDDFMDIITTKGDLIVRDDQSGPSPDVSLFRFPVAPADDGKVLTTDSSSSHGVSWMVFPDIIPLTTKGDLMVTNNSDDDDRLPLFTPADDDKVLTVDGSGTFGVGWLDYPPFVAPVVDKRQLVTFGGPENTIIADTPVVGNIAPNGRYLVADSSKDSGLSWVDASNVPLPSLTTDDTLFVADSTGSSVEFSGGSVGSFLVADSSAPLGVQWVNQSTIVSGALQLFDLKAIFTGPNKADDVVTTPGTITWQRCCARDDDDLDLLKDTWFTFQPNLSTIIQLTGNDGIRRGAFNPLKNGLFVIEANIKWNPPIQIPVPGIYSRLCILPEFHVQWSTLDNVKYQYFPLISDVSKVNNESTYAEATSLGPSNTYGTTAMCTLTTTILVQDYTTFDTLYLRCFGKNETVSFGFSDDMQDGSTMRIRYFES